MADRVPQKDTDFNSYINSTTDHLIENDPLPANWERLGLTLVEFNTWKSYRQNWNEAYEITTKNAERGISDSNATKAKNDVRKKFTDWVTDPAVNKLNRIGSSPNVTDTDRTIFHIKLRDQVRTARPQITTAPFVDLKGDEGAFILITCRVQSDANRANMHKDADVIEVKYALLATDAPPPTSPEECPDTELSPKAIFRLSAGMANAGKRLYGYLRWRNNSEPEKSSPWNQRVTVIVGD
jgi:hypothetical protein